MSLHQKPDGINFNLENEESYKDLFDNAHDLVHFADLEGTLIYVNRSWMNTLGYAIEEIQGKSLFSFLEDEYKSSFHQYRNEIMLHAKEPHPITICVRTKNGKKLFLEGTVTVKRKDGTPIYTRGIFRDITTKLENEEQLKQYNQTLLQREAALQQLLNNAPDAVIVIDTNSRILFWNPKAEVIFGWKSEEVLHTNLSDKIIPPIHRAAHDAGMKRFLSTGEARVLNRTVEITALNKSGAEFYISLTISTTMQKESTAFIAFIRDISEQKKNQLELENKRKELEETN